MVEALPADPAPRRRAPAARGDRGGVARRGADGGPALLDAVRGSGAVASVVTSMPFLVRVGSASCGRLEYGSVGLSSGALGLSWQRSSSGGAHHVALGFVQQGGV